MLICSLSEVNKYRPLPTGGIVQNNSPYKEIFNRKFTMMRERGLMDRGKQLWNPRKPECNWKQDALVIGIEPLFLAYLVLILGALISLILLAIELYKARMEGNKIISTQDQSKFFIK
ncbi:hypothetical protein O3M35_003637 [Rhynocoris fuscipes]|uniref:Uncharacterized protein n=1 Tax=Rhynocoris fuscipes TaxID=488301 RepID=A0AAW1CS92_9HEMI